MMPRIAIEAGVVGRIARWSLKGGSSALPGVWYGWENYPGKKIASRPQSKWV